MGVDCVRPTTSSRALLLLCSSVRASRSHPLSRCCEHQYGVLGRASRWTSTNRRQRGGRRSTTAHQGCTEIDDKWSPKYGDLVFDHTIPDACGMMSRLNEKGFDVTVWWRRSPPNSAASRGRHSRCSLIELLNDRAQLGSSCNAQMRRVLGGCFLPADNSHPHHPRPNLPPSGSPSPSHCCSADGPAADHRQGRGVALNVSDAEACAWFERR